MNPISGSSHIVKVCIYTSLSVVAITGLCLQIIAAANPSLLSFTNEIVTVIALSTLTSFVALIILSKCQKLTNHADHKNVASLTTRSTLNGSEPLLSTSAPTSTLSSTAVPTVPQSISTIITPESEPPISNLPKGIASCTVAPFEGEGNYIYFFSNANDFGVIDNITLVPASLTGSPWGIYGLGDRRELFFWNRNTGRIYDRRSALENQISPKELSDVLSKGRWVQDENEYSTLMAPLAGSKSSDGDEAIALQCPYSTDNMFNTAFVNGQKERLTTLLPFSYTRFDHIKPTLSQ